MKVVALVSGGKDSCFAMMKSIDYGHQIVALANLLPVDDAVDELDSYMYQTVGHQIVIKYAECMGVPLFRKRIRGTTRHQSLSYKKTQGDEVEDMFILLSEIKRQIPSITAVSSGAIASDYQRLRVESVCSRLGLVSLAYLWKQDQSLLLQEMITNGIVAITVKVAAMGLDPAKHLGKDMAYLESYLHKLKELYGINVCGEGGEYETLTLDCPLFFNARIILDDFLVVLHSSDAIAPVGVLHPLTFHLEHKTKSISDSQMNGICKDESSVCEVDDNCLLNCETTSKPVYLSDLVAVTENELKISLSKKDDTFSISCWLPNSCKTSIEHESFELSGPNSEEFIPLGSKWNSSSFKGLQEDMNAVLTNIELQLQKCGFGWENVLYVHLYIDDMDQFSVANETYVRYITQENCPFGVPSRSTIELPLVQTDLGRAYVEVLVASDQSKRVLHVQSISCWAPSCIGPYSQATLHKDVLYMAGQLGLDPPTMVLCEGGPTAELELALHNCEAVAKSFKCSISTSAILFVVYCSKLILSSDTHKIQEKLDTVLKQMKLLNLENGRSSQVLDPLFLFVIVPDLPKRALVEVKPTLHVPDDEERTTTTAQNNCVTPLSYWGFQHELWHDSCIQSCNNLGQICAAVLSISKKDVAKICLDYDSQHCLKEEQMEKIARFCIYLFDKALMEHNLSWDDGKNVRIYFPISLGISYETLTLIFSKAFAELSEMSPRITIDYDPIFNLVPVLGAGNSAVSMDDIITCELFARKS